MMNGTSWGALLLALLISTAAAAQVGQTELTGTVVDESGAILPGATVTATLTATGLTRTTHADESGRYRFNNLPVGSYRIRSEMPGFRTTVAENVRLSVGQSATLDLRMSVAGLEEALTVQAELPLIQTTRSELSGNISDVQVEELPLLGRNWLGFAQLAPGIKSDGTEAGTNTAPTAGIGVGRQDKVFLDGTDLNNRSTAISVDIQISKEVISEFQVKTSQFDAQWGQSGTSIVQAISKSGSDDFRGNGYFYFRDDSLNAADFFTATTEPYRNEQFGGTLGGPIVRGRAHFFFNYERHNEPQTLTSNTGIASLDVPVDGTDTRNLWFGRVDHQITRDHRLAGRYNRFTRFQPAAGTGGNLPPIAARDFDFKVNRYSLSLDSVLAGTWVNSLTFSVLDTVRIFGRRDPGPFHIFPSVSLGGQPGGIGEEVPFYWAVRDDASTFFERWGNHNVKFGGYFERAHLTGFFAFATNGVFSYNQDPPNLAACCSAPSQAEWDTSQFPIPLTYTQLLGDPSIDAPNTIFGWYVQNDWQIHPRFTFNLGVRHDIEFGSLMNNLDQALLQPPFDHDLNNFQPRLGFAYDLLGDNSTTLRGGAGKFNSQTFLNISFFVERTNRVRQLNVAVANPTMNPNFARDPLGGMTFEDFQQRIGDPEFPLDIAIMDPDAEQPGMWSYSLGLARQLTPNWAVSADYVHQRSNDQLRSIDSNLFCCRADGHALPVVSGNFPHLGGMVQGHGRPDPRFNNIRTFVNAGRARYHGLQVALNRRWADNIQFGLTYLLSRNQDDFSDAFDYPSNNFNLADEFSDSTHDQRHRLTLNWVTRLPYDFTFSGIVFSASGRGLSAHVGGLDLYGVASEPRGRNARPVCGVDPRFDPGCTALGIPTGQIVPRNAFRSDTVYRLDLRLARAFEVDRIRLEPSLEMFNLFNRENHDPTRFNTNLGSAAFGSPGRSPNLPYLPRQAQLGVKVSF
jgi:hypothetical protein